MEPRIITKENVTVLTGPEWLFNLYKNEKNDKGTRAIDPIINPHGQPWIPPSVLEDPTWNTDLVITGPNGISKPIKDWLEPIPLSYYEEVREDEPEPDE